MRAPAGREPAADRRAARLRARRASRCSSTTASGDLNPLAIALAAASLLAVMVRLTLTFRENVAMLRASRDEALTDALTGLGNRRALARDARRSRRTSPRRGAAERRQASDPARARAVRPRRLQALQRHLRPPGRRRAARAPRRQPRRVPRGPRPRVPHGRRRVLRAVRARRRRAASRSCSSAAAALSETGDGFTIGCSYGSILLPDEASEPAEALRIADQRMYAQKHAGRMSAGRQSKDVLLRALAERNPDARRPPLERRRARRAHRAPARAAAPRRSSGSATPASCTTPARSRSPTRSSPSPVR